VYLRLFVKKAAEIWRQKEGDFLKQLGIVLKDFADLKKKKVSSFTQFIYSE
jgi:hypothetical protein